MTTDFLRHQTQVGFNFPGSGYMPPGFIPSVSVPQRSMELGQGQRAAHQMNQLQFNLGIPTSPEKLTTRFRRPQPIVIEKLSDQTQSHKLPPSHMNTPNFYSVGSSVSSSMSSDRLALAMHLAKRDLKKIRDQGTGNGLVAQEEELVRHVTIAPKERGIAGKKGRGKSQKAKGKPEVVEDAVTLRERVHNVAKKQDVAFKKQHQLIFYPTHGEDDGFESDRERTQAKEIRKLRQELHQYMRQMQELRKEGPDVLKNKDKRLKRRREEDVRLSDEDFDRRQVARAEEQASRSARMLYVLQRQVREIEDELNKRGRGIKHTKKSQTLSRLAAAHRGAVRALQTFVSQAPLQPKVSHGLPPMYQELSALVRQLSLLATELHIGGDDLSAEIKRIEQEEKVEVVEPKVDADKTPEKTSAFMQEVAGSSPQRTETLKPSLKRQAVTSSPDPTPERNAVLQAGLSALLRAKNTPIVPTPMVNPRPQQKPALQPFKAVKQSLLLPSKLKLMRQKAQQAVKRVQLPQAVEQARFAQDTVSSILKKAPSGGTPPRTPTKEVPRSPGKMTHQEPWYPASPRSHRRDCELQLQSPRSPKYARRVLAVEEDIIEREIARQRWLDEESGRRLDELEGLRRTEKLRRNRLSGDTVLSRRVVSETEEAIRSRLQPLLDRAQAIADTNTKLESDQKQSLQHQLGKLASETTMNQADILAEKVLDEILEETALEMQRLEVNDEADEQTEHLQNSSTIENLLQRLQAFEKVEEEIRRHWVQVKYSDVEKAVGKETAGKSSLKATDPTPIMFTRSEATTKHRVVSEDERSPREQGRRETERPSRLMDELSDTNSLCSVIEGSSGGSSTRDLLGTLKRDVKAPLSRPLAATARPTVSISVPSEMRASVVSYRNRFNKYLRDTATHEQGEFDPWGLVDRISEDLLEDMLHDVGNELDHVCGDYAEALYSEEFAAANSES